MASRTNEPKVQALSWLVSQLRWEQTLDELRDARPANLPAETPRAA